MKQCGWTRDWEKRLEPFKKILKKGREGSMSFFYG